MTELRHLAFVTVFERHRYTAMETSLANGGQLSVSNAEVWNDAATVIKALRWMLTRDAPLLLNPSPSWHTYSWMSEFSRHIGNCRPRFTFVINLSNSRIVPASARPYIGVKRGHDNTNAGDANEPDRP